MNRSLRVSCSSFFLLLVVFLPSVLPVAPAGQSAATILVKLQPALELSPAARVKVSSSPTTRQNQQSAQRLDHRLKSLHACAAETLGPGSHTYRVTFCREAEPQHMIAALTTDPSVVFAEPDSPRHAMLKPDDPNLSHQWALEKIQAFDAWDITTGSNIVIAVVDTGVSSTHPDLEAKLLPGYNAMLDNSKSEDDHGHGTAIAGLIAAESDNHEGIAGVCWGCYILPVKVLDEHGAGKDSDLARGIRWATDQGANIINLSLGGAENSHALRDAIEYAFRNGVLIIASSGNDHRLGNFTNYPAAYPQVVAVGATTNSDKITGFSNTGDYIDLVAPGVGLWTTTIDGDYGPPNGTSFSSPFVAGVAGLILSLRPELGSYDVRCILSASTDDQGEPGKDPSYGWGRLNALRAVQLAQDYTSCPLDLSLSTAEERIKTAFAPVEPPATGAPEQIYFPETRHTLQGEFKLFWQQHGGLPIFGYPISEAFLETSKDGEQHMVQYFERHRFELHPEKPVPYHVQLSRLGDVLLSMRGRDWFTFPKAPPAPNCRFFEATGHTLCDPFLSYWQSHGLEFDGQPGTSFAESLALFGQPISEPQVEEIAPGVRVPVQWFERSRFEDHGETGGVLLGLLSSELVEARHWR